VGTLGGGETSGWTAELESRGIVQVPQRRRRLLVRLALVCLLFANSLWSFVDDLRFDSFGGTDFFRGLSVIGFLVVVGFTLWQFVTGRPVLTVDRNGISLGRHQRRSRLQWNEIGKIADPAGIPGLRSVQILPLNVWAAGFAVSQDNVKDLDAFAVWLRHCRESMTTGRAFDE
jgi:hypothetical protein